MLHRPGHALSEFIVGYKERPLRCKERANCIHVDTKAANLVLLGCWVGRRYGAIRYAMFTPEVFDESVADRKGGVGGQCIARPEKHVDMVGLKLVIDVERAVVGTERRGNQSRVRRRPRSDYRQDDPAQKRHHSVLLLSCRFAPPLELLCPHSSGIGRGTYIDLDPPRYGWPHHQRRRANRNIILNLSHIHHHEDKKKSWKILHLDSKGR